LWYSSKYFEFVHGLEFLDQLL